MMVSEPSCDAVSSAMKVGSEALIVHVIHRLDHGGMETVLVDLINRMRGGRFRHAVVCLKDYTDFRVRIASADVEVFALGKREGKDLRSYWRLWRLLRRLRPALVNTYNFAALDVAPLARLTGARVVHAEHGWQSGREGVPEKYIRLRRLMRRFIDRFVAVSWDLEDWLRDTVGVPTSRLTCIHNGVDDVRFRGNADARSRIREQLGVDADTFVVGTVARLDPVKAQTLLIEAVARLAAGKRSQARDIRLVIVGEGPERPRLEALIRDRHLEDVVWLTGARADIPELLAGFDVFALPSHNEGVSISILEAMAVGLPVAATRVGGNPEVVVDGTTGQLVPDNDVDALTQALTRYRDDVELRRAHGAAGRARQRQAFSLDGMVGRYARLYDDVLNGRPATAERKEIA